MGSGGLSRLVAVASNTFRETVRERVLYNLVFFAILMTVSGLLMGELSIRQDQKIIKDLGLASMDVFGLLIAIYMGVGLVNKEIERRSLYPLLAKPLTRTELLLGKFAGLSFTLLVNVGAMTVGLYLTLLGIRASADPHLLEAIYAIFLGLLLIVAVALLFSTVTSSALATVLTVCVVVAGRFSDLIRDMRDMAPLTPAWLVKVLYYAVPNLREFDLKNHVVYGDPITLPDLAQITAYAAVYATLVLGVACLALRSRDLQ
jgi:ABC-type transport system involved in multi-copper enzyme maturation permease subunit